MAELVIGGDAGYSNVPVDDIGTPPDYSQIQGIAIECDWTGTLSDPVTIWKSGNAYIKCAHYSDTHGGENWRLEVNPLPHWTPSTAPPFYLDFGNVHDVYIGGCLTGTSGIVFLSNDGTFPKTDYLFYGARIDLEAQLIEERGWDETPAEDEDDLNNENAQGGEFADRGFFGDTDQMPEGGLPDPSIFEEDYNGLLTCYAMFGSGFADFGKSVFQTSFWQSLMNKFNGLSDPLSMIIDCVELPIGHIGSPWVGSAPMMLGGIDVPFYNGSNVYIQHTWARRYYKTNCGSITLKEVWGSAKDYTDASISIYLPYCGVKELDPDIVLRNTLTLYVYVDLWNGDVLYLLHTSNTGFDKKYFAQEAVVYRWTGNCGKKIPIGKVDTSNAIMQVASGIATVGLGVAAGGALGGAMFGAGGSIGAGMIGSSVMGGVNQLADVAANGFKPVVQTSGGVGGSVGRMDYQYPYLIIKRGIPEYPNNWRAEIGAPQYQTYTVSDLTGTGYTLFSHIELGNMGSATEEEKSELERLLTTEGVIL